MIISEVLQSEGVQRLKSLIMSRFGSVLEIQSLRSGSEESLFDKAHKNHHGNLEIPISVNERYLATAVIRGAANFTDQDVDTVENLVRMVLEPTLYGWYIRQTTENMAAGSSLKTDRADLSAEVIPLNIGRDPFAEKATEVETEIRQKSLSIPYLVLEASNPHALPRVAHHVHDIRQNMAMLNWCDIQSAISSANDLRSLRDTTVFIPDLLLLNPQQQSIIAQYLSEDLAYDQCFLLIGAVPSYEELVQQERLPKELLNLIRLYRVNVNNLPTEFGRLRETLEMLLGPSDDLV